MSSNTRSQALRFVLLAGCELLRRSDKRCSLAPQQLVLQLAEVRAVDAPCGLQPQGIGQTADDVHRYRGTGAKRAKQRKTLRINKKTSGKTGIAYEAPVAKHTYENTYVVRVSQSTFWDFNIYRCEHFAIYFWISECPWALLGRQKTPTCANNNNTNTSIARRHDIQMFRWSPAGLPQNERSHQHLKEPLRHFKNLP